LENGGKNSSLNFIIYIVLLVGSVKVSVSHNVCHGQTRIKTYVCVYVMYEGWNFNSGNYLFTTDTK